MQVSILSLIFMAVSALISIGLPVFLFVLFYKRYNAKFIPMITGAAAFIVFALILENLVHSVVLTRFRPQDTPVVYIIYGALMAGLFEESARFISYKLLKKKYSGIGTGLSYGAGHGGIESILLVGMTMISNLVLCIMLNTGNAEFFTKNVTGDALTRLNAQINALSTVNPAMFLVAGMERIFAVGIQISLAVIVYYSVYRKDKLYLYPLAVIIHALTDVPALLAQTGIIKHIAVVEICAGISAVVLIVLAKTVHEKLKEVNPASPLPHTAA